VHEFNESYYSTVAQVIPVLYLALVGTRIASGDPIKPRSTASALGLLGVTGLILLGELAALDALDNRESSGLRDFAIIIGYSLPLLGIFMPVIGEAWVRAWRPLDTRIRYSAEMALAVLVVGLGVSDQSGIDPDQVFYAAALAFFFGAALAGRLLMIRDDAREVSDEDD
jgi:hypothetical protein